MKRRLPYEPEQLISKLTSWIDWRYAAARNGLVLTSAPTSLPLAVERWMPGAVWRLAWQEDGSAVLYGLCGGSGTGRYFVIRYDGNHSRKEGVFAELPNGVWEPLHGDGLELRSNSLDRTVTEWWAAVIANCPVVLMPR